MDSDITAQTGPYVLHNGAGVPAATPQGSEMLIKAAAAQTGGALGLVEGIDAPGFATVLHRHDPAEAWYILEGEYDYYVEGRWLTAGPGSFAFVPGGLAHGLRVGPSGGRKLTLVVPGGMEGFFQDVHTNLERGELDPDIVHELSQRYGITDLGPLPHRPDTAAP